MKKSIFILLAILLCVSGVAFAIDGRTAGTNEPGEIKAKFGTMAEPDRTFRLVRYMPPAAGAINIASLTVDSIVIWDPTSEDGVTVTTTTTSGDCRVAGVAACTFLTPEYYGRTASNDLSGRNWGYIQTYGLCNVRAGSKGIDADKAFGTGENPGCIVTMDSSDIAGVATRTSPTNWTTAGFTFKKQETASGALLGFIRCQ